MLKAFVTAALGRRSGGENLYNRDTCVGTSSNTGRHTAFFPSLHSHHSACRSFRSDENDSCWSEVRNALVSSFLNPSSRISTSGTTEL